MTARQPSPRSQILKQLREVTDQRYPMRWVADVGVAGDFDGRATAISVFNIELEEERAFLRQVRSLRPKLDEMACGRVNFIFHNPEASRTHYAHVMTEESP